MGNAFTRWLGRTVFGLMGWRCEGKLPNIKKLVVAGGPHTSNWDFVLALSVIMGVGIKLSWLGKHSIFFWPFDRMWRAVGGIPVNRHAPVGLVDQVVESFHNNDAQVVAIMPEGTRSKVKKWKTGFLRIAYNAQVPLFVVTIDYPTKRIMLGPVLELSGDENKDLKQVQELIGRGSGKLVNQQ
jgi:1-acyl-sn-glycerol-3-phosphate acyltransferase